MVYTSSKSESKNTSSLIFQLTSCDQPSPSSSRGNPPLALTSSGSSTGRHGSVGSKSELDDINTTDPIVDIKVIFHKKEDKVPAGYTLLKKSVGGLVSADLNKASGGKNVYLCYKRQSQLTSPSTSVVPTPSSRSSATESLLGHNEDKPITAMLIFFPDKQEEPPYGFTSITTSVDGSVADLNASQGTRY
jgi:hypothetical protein